MHATPAASPDEVVACNKHAPSSSLFEDRFGDDPVQKHLQQVQALAKHSALRATTGTTMLHEWNPEYIPLAFPFSLSRPVGGADFPRRKAFVKICLEFAADSIACVRDCKAVCACVGCLYS